MSLPRHEIDELFIQSIKDNLHFLMRFFKVQISCLQNMIYSPKSIAEQQYAEKQLVESLRLIDNILMHQYSKSNLISQCDGDDIFSCCNDQVKEINHLIAEFSWNFERYQFIVQSYEEQCKHLIDQISSYFCQDHVEVIIVEDQLPQPWLAIPFHSQDQL